MITRGFSIILSVFCSLNLLPYSANMFLSYSILCAEFFKCCWNNLILGPSISWFYFRTIKVAFSPSKKNYFISFNENPLKMIKKSSYFNIKALFVLKIFKFLSWLFGHMKKGLIFIKLFMLYYTN